MFIFVGWVVVLSKGKGSFILTIPRVVKKLFLIRSHGVIWWKKIGLPKQGE
jgi:hypothetical protein